MATRVPHRSGLRGALVIAFAVLLLPASALPQQAIVPLQLIFSDPGARSTGFGGAFVALADDATAAFANPAGLVQLLKPELAIEVRQWSYSTPYTTGGRLEGEPSGFGIDTTSGLKRDTSTYEATGVSFLSFAYPLGDWSIALYRHKYADLAFSGETEGFFGGGSDCCQTRWFDQQMASEQDIVGYGLSAAYRVNDRFSIGLGDTYYDISLEARTAEFKWDDDSPESFFAPTSFLADRLAISERLFIDHSDWAFSGGILWKLTDSWRVGGVYREGIEAELGNHVTAGYVVDYGVPPGTVIMQNRGIPIEFPDIFGIGLAYQTLDGRLTLSFQWDRVEYSSIPESLQLDDQTIDDADEWHLGAEYVFLASTPVIAFRLGAWFEPDHQMHATIDDVFTRAMLPPGDDQWHYSAGLGLAMQRFQIDIAVDVADLLDTLSISAVYNF